MSIGPMRHRITFQQGTRTDDGAGGNSIAWTDVVTTWADIKPLSGGESMRAQQLENPITHRITCRHRTNVTAAMRILYGARVFNIRSIRNTDERKRYLTMDVQENVAQ